MTIDNYKNLRLDGRIFDLSNRDIDYRALLKKYFLSKWYLYFISFALLVGLTYFYLSTIEPSYEIRSKLLITEGERDSGSPEDWLKKSLNFSAIPDNVYNEIQVLTSFALVNKVVNYLNLDINYTWKDGVYEKTGYKDFPVRVSRYDLHSPKYYDIPLTVELGEDRETFALFMEDIKVGSYQFGEQFTNTIGTFCFQRNEVMNAYPESVLQIQFSNPAAMTESYLRRLHVGFIDIKSTTLEIVLEDAVPERGVEILENLIIRYHQIKNQENNRIANNTLQFIDERLIDIGTDLRNIESSVESYKLDNNIASESTSDLQIVLENSSKLNTEKQELQVQLNVLESIKKGLDMSSDHFELIPMNSSITKFRLEELVMPYNGLVLEQRRLLEGSMQPSHPMALSNRQKILSMRNSIFAAIENLQGDLRFQINSVQNQYGRSVAQLRSMPRKERQLTDKSRQQGIVENLYTYLLQKREETALSLIGTATNSILIDPPRSTTTAVAPNKLKYYLAGSFAGMALPFLLISVVELLKDSIESEDQLKNLVPNYSIIGLINQRAVKGKQIVMQQERTLISDRFRSLRTNLQFLSGDEARCIMVTSSTSKEGKTFIAVNLAASFAMKDEKTVIVDFDLRNPQVANYLEEPKHHDAGLSYYFETKSAKMEEIIHPTKVDNLDYITTGQVPENPDDLVMTEKKLNHLFAYLKANYSTIIVDTSPVGIISEAILLNNYITQSLYVVRVGITKKDMVEKARELFEQDHLVHPMMVLNGVKKGEVYGYKVK